MILIERIKELASTTGEIINHCCNKDDIALLKREANRIFGNSSLAKKVIIIFISVVLISVAISVINQNDNIQQPPVPGIERNHVVSRTIE